MALEGVADVDARSKEEQRVETLDDTLIYLQFEFQLMVEERTVNER